MAKRTLLDLTQTILSDITGDRVNSIGDTEESEAIVQILRRAYFDLLTEYNIPTSKGMFTLTALGDTDKPTYFRIPDEVYEVEWVKYDLRTGPSDTQIRYTELPYHTPEEFFHRASMLNSTDANVQLIEDPTDIKILVRTDANPTCWTSFDNRYVVFDSFDSAIEATLQSSKVVSYGTKGASWTSSDSFIPDLPDHLFPLLLSTAENKAFEFLKQTSNRLVDSQERRMRRRFREQGDRIDNSIRGPNYGR
jgi:hypothetical protein